MVVSDRSSAPDQPASGLTVVDKPAGITSHDVVSRMRRIAGTRKVGHGGTLDPMATGVLVLAIGRATRLLTFISGSDKTYSATIRLGVATVSDDADGEQVSRADASGVAEEQVRDELAKLTGDIAQVPSAVSAVKVAGRRSYARVRAGEQVELAPRPVRVRRFELRGVSRPEADLLDCEVEVECSAGTYVRALARDLGDALQVGGHLTVLRRMRAGVFNVADARALEELQERGPAVALSLSEAAAALFPRREVTETDAVRVSHGNPLPAVGIAGPYALFGPSGVLAVVRESDGLARPDVVLAPAVG